MCDSLEVPRDVVQRLEQRALAERRREVGRVERARRAEEVAHRIRVVHDLNGDVDRNVRRDTRVEHHRVMRVLGEVDVDALLVAVDVLEVDLSSQDEGRIGRAAVERGDSVEAERFREDDQVASRTTDLPKLSEEGNIMWQIAMVLV
jgi:hypothetical protein